MSGAKIILIDGLLVGSHDDEDKLSSSYSCLIKCMEGITNIYKTTRSNTIKNYEYLHELEKVHRNDWTYVIKYIQNENHPIPFPNDRLLMLAIVKVKGLLMRFASESLRDDKEFVLECVRHHQSAFRYASERLRGDEDVIKMAANIESLKRDVKLKDVLYKCDFSLNPNHLGLLSLFQNPNRLRNIIPYDTKASNWWDYQYRLNQSYKSITSYREVVLEAIRANPKVIFFLRKKYPEKEYIIEALKSGRETKRLMKLVTTDSLNDPQFLLEIGLLELLFRTSFTSDCDFMLEWIKRYGLNLQLFKFCDAFDFEFWEKLLDANLISPVTVPTKYFEKLNTQTQKQILSIEGCLLEYMPHHVKNNVEIVSEIVEKFPEALAFASEEIRNNIDVVNIAIHSKTAEAEKAIRFASNTIRNSRQVFDSIMTLYNQTFEFFGEEIRSDPSFYRKIFVMDLNIKNAPECIRNDLELARYCIGEKVEAYPHFSEVVRFDFKLACGAISNLYRSLPLKQQNKILKIFPQSLRDNQEIVETLVQYEPGLFCYVSPRLRSNGKLVKNLLIASAEWSHKIFKIFDHHLVESKEELLDIYQAMEEICKTSYYIRREPFYFAGAKLLMDKEFVQQEFERLNINVENAYFSSPILSLICSLHYKKPVHFNFDESSKFPPSFTQPWIHNFEDEIENAITLIQKTSNSTMLDFTKLPEKLKQERQFLEGICGFVPLLEHLDQSQITKTIIVGSNAVMDKVLEYAPPNVKDDGELVLSLLSEEAKLPNLHFISERLKRDEEFFSKILGRYPMALQYASDELRNDLDLIMSVKTSSPYTMYEYASPSVLARLGISINFISLQKCRKQQQLDNQCWF